ncbi:MAG: alpha/beta hydrolase [Chloroflexi bacterium]|nr:MAG: alpha/beta hydrolase [Chloroflexota bacterium]TME13549.1 MAG: alpha/beta hydrolase [Chloroflexota bacterium]
MTPQIRVGAVEVGFTDRGVGRPFLLLHGGAGPQSVTGFADLLAETEHVWVITPTHPGFGGTSRPDALDTIGGLARLYVELLNQLDLTDVAVIGNSVGGWIGAEMALLGSPRISRIILVDAVGIEVPGHPVADFFALTMDQVAEFSYHTPDSYRIDVSKMSPPQRAAMAGNRAALAVYGGTPSMVDPTLRERLKAISIPTLVLWGESDRIADPDYGRAYADAIPTARFQLLAETGHVPQIETPELLLSAMRDFADSR